MTKAIASILVVDDQADLLENIELALEAFGYRVMTAHDGIEALEVLKSQPVDLILADIAMPRMNGYQLYERVRDKMQWVTIPFVFLTARALDSDVRYGKELGADDYLTKPIQPEDLLAAVQGKLRRTEQLAQVASLPEAPLTLEKRSLSDGCRLPPASIKSGWTRSRFGFRRESLRCWSIWPGTRARSCPHKSWCWRRMG
jgi:DNA-binding response OmpR family regulator